MPAPDRGEGLIEGNCWVQVVPSQTQVSPKSPESPEPPNSTTCPCASSYVMLWRVRPGGLTGGCFCVQVVPSHTQLSDKFKPTASPNPPNKTTCVCAAS